MKMIKMVSFITIIALCVGLTSCAKNISTDKEVQSDETNRPQNIPEDSTSNERIFLNIALEGETATNKFVDSSRYGIYTSQNRETFKSLSNTAVKTLPFGSDKEFVYQYSDCRYKNSESKEYGTFYSIYDVYTDGKAEIMYLNGTDLLCVYSGGIEGMVLEEQTKEAAKKLADDLLLQFLTQEELDKYTDIEVDDEHILYSYYIRYTREIEGYRTDEELWISFNKKGEMRNYVGYNLKKYDALEDRITKEKLDAAKEALLDKLSSTEKLDFEHEEPKIITDTSGNVYLEIQYSYRLEEGGAKRAEAVAVSVN